MTNNIYKNMEKSNIKVIKLQANIFDFDKYKALAMKKDKTKIDYEKIIKYLNIELSNTATLLEHTDENNTDLCKMVDKLNLNIKEGNDENMKRFEGMKNLMYEENVKLQQAENALDNCGLFIKHIGLSGVYDYKTNKTLKSYTSLKNDDEDEGHIIIQYKKPTPEELEEINEGKVYIMTNKKG